jgi:hypothetical protein
MASCARVVVQKAGLFHFTEARWIAKNNTLSAASSVENAPMGRIAFRSCELSDSMQLAVKSILRISGAKESNGITSDQRVCHDLAMLECFLFHLFSRALRASSVGAVQIGLSDATTSFRST